VRGPLDWFERIGREPALNGVAIAISIITFLLFITPAVWRFVRFVSGSLRHGIARQYRLGKIKMMREAHSLTTHSIIYDYAPRGFVKFAITIFASICYATFASLLVYLRRIDDLGDGSEDGLYDARAAVMLFIVFIMSIFYFILLFYRELVLFRIHGIVARRRLIRARFLMSRGCG
jgi:hypothetical protein